MMVIIRHGLSPFNDYFLRYGVVLKELSAPAEARKMFIHSISLTPLLWASWRELAKLCEDRAMVSNQYFLTTTPHFLGLLIGIDCVSSLTAVNALA